MSQTESAEEVIRYLWKANGHSIEMCGKFTPIRAKIKPAKEGE